MAKIAVLSYIKRESVLHELTGTAKLIFFLMWSIATMATYDTRILLILFVGSIVIFKISNVRFREIRLVVILAGIFLLLNNLFVYLFSPEYGVEIYESRTVLFSIAGPYTITLQQLFYHFNMTLKVVCVIPVALLFIACTDPSEFAASLASIGVSYRVGYAVSLALRYIPDVQRDYTHISQAQQARGIDLSGKDKLWVRMKNSVVGYAVSLALRYIPDVQRDYTHISQAQQARGIDLSGKDKLWVRMKNSVAILLPLILSSLNRIETISNAMELRGFGKKKKRTWYVLRKMKKADYITIILAVALLAVDLLVTFWDGSRYYNPFI